MEELIKKARQHDADAFTELMMSQMQTMYKTARAILSNEEDAADAISDTILACWEKRGQLRENKYFRTWLTKILVNKCKDIIRKKSPVDYKEDLEKAIGIEKIRTSLKENGLAETIFTANETDVIQILDDRRRQMALEIRDFYKTL